MSVYVIVDNDVIDPQPYRDYLALITPTVARYGGRYRVRAGQIHFADSDWRPDRMVVIEFDNLEAAQAWVDSDDTREIHAMRRRHAHSRLIIIDGVDDATSTPEPS